MRRNVCSERKIKISTEKVEGKRNHEFMYNNFYFFYYFTVHYDKERYGMCNKATYQLKKKKQNIKTMWISCDG